MLTYRLAQTADAQLYFDWANDPDTRRQSFTSNPISLETHTAWFTRKLAAPDAFLLVFSDEADHPVGQVRFERTPVADMPAEIVISVSVDPSHRGKGIAARMIKQACAFCQEQWDAVTIHAYIKPENQASVRAFEGAGFTLSGESGKFATADATTTDHQQMSLLYLKTL